MREDDERMHPGINIVLASQDRIRQLDLMKDDFNDVQREITSVIEQVEIVKEDLYGEDSRRPSFFFICCRCRNRDLRKLEDRLWLRLHQLQEKENELHRQRTALLSLPLHSGIKGEEPTAVRQPSPVSPEEAPESPPWQQRPPRPNRRQQALTRSAGNHRPPTVSYSTQSHSPVRIESTQPSPVSIYQPPRLRRRPSRPGSAEDTGSGAE